MFECAGESPKMFQHNVRVKVDSDGIKQFSFQFHREENFFPNKEPFSEDYSDDILIEKAQQLFNDLAQVIPLGEYKEDPLLHLIRLELSPHDVVTVKTMSKPEDAHEYISQNMIVNESSPYCPQHFGFNSIKKNMPWTEVFARWKEKTENNQASDAWVDEIYNEIWRAIHNSPAKPTGSILKSANSDREYIPMVCLMREYPDGRIIFNTYLYPKF